MNPVHNACAARQRATNVGLQVRWAELYIDVVCETAAEHGVLMVHDELMFESAEDAARFNKILERKIATKCGLMEPGNGIPDACKKSQ